MPSFLGKLYLKVRYKILVWSQIYETWILPNPVSAFRQYLNFKLNFCDEVIKLHIN